MGIHGISVAPLIMNQVLIPQTHILGDFKKDGKAMINEYTNILLLDSSARAVGAVRTLVEDVFNFIKTRKRNNIVGELADNPVVRLRLGTIMTKFLAM